jgi:hypothetical protein
MLVGCNPAAHSQSSLAREVGELAVVGMADHQAEAALTKAGFNCGPNVTGPRGDRECDRFKGYAALSTCVQRAYLMLDASRQRISGIEVPQPACAGL